MSKASYPFVEAPVTPSSSPKGMNYEKEHYQQTSNNATQDQQNLRRRNQPQHHHHPGRRNGGNSGRLWQLPQYSIQEYAAWIEQKPSDTQSASEQRFLHKFKRRMLVRQHKFPKESMKQYIARLEAKEKMSDAELQLIEQYHRQKANRRAQRLRRDDNPFRGSIPQPIFWRREGSQKMKTPPPPPPPTPSGPSVSSILSNMANLQESMNRMGLSSDKLRDIPMDDDSNPATSMFSSKPFSFGERAE